MIQPQEHIRPEVADARIGGDSAHGPANVIPGPDSARNGADSIRYGEADSLCCEGDSILPASVDSLRCGADGGAFADAEAPIPSPWRDTMETALFGRESCTVQPKRFERHVGTSLTENAVFQGFVLLLAGIYGYTRMQTNLFPEVLFPRITVIADAGQQPVDRMMITVTKPLESAVKKVPGTQMQQPLAVAVIGGFVAGLPLLLVVLPALMRRIYR